MDSKLTAAIWHLLLLLLLALIGPSLAAEHGDRQECIRKLADYVAAANVEPAIKTLLEISRATYPDVEQLIAAEIPSRSYVKAIQEVGSQYGCEEIQQHINQMAQKFECYTRFQLDMDAEATLEVAKTNKMAGEVFEAFVVCNTAESGSGSDLA